ncbi:MAG: AraC family transcriptional regulator [Candidatus Eisenbacteria bacterium]|nr:AraC family transcriptional regulator [Candidatus Eisenbacteria bacterium]
MSKAPPSIAATSTLAMVRTAEARGVRTADLLEEAGISRASLDDPDARLPGPVVLSIWNALRDRTADPVLQLTAPVSLPFGAYRVIDYLVAASATVGDGVRRFARFFRLIADAVTLEVRRTGHEYQLCLERSDGGAVPPVYVDYVFAALVGRTRMRIRPDLRVLRVDLRQPAPQATAPYVEVFRAPVRFGADADRLCFTEEEWNAPTESGDAALARLLEEHARILAQRIPQAPPGFRTEVQKAIASTLPEGGSAVEVARALHVSVRTLQRKLVEIGTTFREMSDSVRAQLAEEYLTDPQVSIAEVAFLLGFSDQSAFHRAFRRRTGESPGRWRRRRG